MAKLLMLTCLLAAFLDAGCAHRVQSKETSDAKAGWIRWKARRMESVAGTNGWTTVVGLHWLQEGRQSAGSNPTNDVVLASTNAAPHVGWFVRSGLNVRFMPAEGIEPSIDGRPTREESLTLESDANSKPTVLGVNGVRIVVLKRGDRIGLRVRDPRSPARLGFRGWQLFPYDPAWRIEARFEPASPGEVLRVQDVIGGVQEFPVPGRLAFKYSGREHRLVAVQEPDEQDLFVIFRDETAGESTYPAGRFLYVSRPDANGRVMIDFNLCYTPPCGFTSFATCPLPPRENRLPFKIRAGEKKPAGH